MQISFLSAKNHEEWLYFWNRGFNSLCRLNLNDNTYELIAYDDKYSFFSDRLYSSVEIIDNSLYFAPLRSNRLAVYNLESRDIEYYPVDNNSTTFSDERFTSIHCIGNCIYLVGLSSLCIAQFDLVSKESTFFDGWKEEFKYTLDNKKDFCNHSIVTSNTIIAPACYENLILEFDVVKQEWITYTVPDYDNGFSGISYDGVYYWLSPMEGNTLVKWEKETNRFEKIELPYNNGENEVQYGGCICFDDKVFVPKSWRKEVVVVSESEKGVAIETLHFSEGGNPFVLSYSPIQLTNCNDGRLFASDNISRTLYEIEAGKEIHMRKIEPNMKKTGDVMNSYVWKKNDFIKEGEVIAFPEFIDYILQTGRE